MGELAGKGRYSLSAFRSEYVPRSAQVGKLNIDGSGTNQHVAGLVNQITACAFGSAALVCSGGQHLVVGFTCNAFYC